MQVEQTIRENGAVPATIAIIGGKLKAGCTPEEIEYLGKKGQAVTKASRRDLPVLIARKEDGATTVTTTMIIAALAGIKVFATGGIGGVHRMRYLRHEGALVFSKIRPTRLCGNTRTETRDSKEDQALFS